MMTTQRERSYISLSLKKIENTSRQQVYLSFNATNLYLNYIGAIQTENQNK